MDEFLTDEDIQGFVARLPFDARGYHSSEPLPLNPLKRWWARFGPSNFVEFTFELSTFFKSLAWPRGGQFIEVWSNQEISGAALSADFRLGMYQCFAPLYVQHRELLLGRLELFKKTMPAKATMVGEVENFIRAYSEAFLRGASQETINLVARWAIPPEHPN